MADGLDSNMDYHFIACSGARTYNVLSIPQDSSEEPQLDQGYLDQNTTLVTLSVGGNDARFSDIFTDCVESLDVCSGDSLVNKDPDNGQTIAGDTGPMDQWAPQSRQL
jgi:hypothetical protein